MIIFTDLITIDDLTNIGTPKTFSNDQINTPAYFKEVRKVIYNFKGHLGSNASFHSLYQTIERHGGSSSNMPAPKLDAIGVILYNPRKIFDAQTFFKFFPNVSNQIEFVRKVLGNYWLK